jgi:hypothetical protein
MRSHVLKALALAAVIRVAGLAMLLLAVKPYMGPAENFAGKGRCFRLEQ